MPEWYQKKTLPAPRVGGSLKAAATRLTKSQITGTQGGGGQSRTLGDNWQNDAWDMYDLVGEQRFLAATLSARMAQARLYVGRVDPDSQTDYPEPVEVDHPAVVPLEVMTKNSPGGAQQLLTRLGANLYVAGEGWVLSYTDGDGVQHFQVASVDEVKTTREGQVELQLDEDEKVIIDPDEQYVIRVWRPHPRWAWRADAATKASLPILRELVGLTLHISAQVDSRLAGAGLLIVPQSARSALRGDDAEGDNEFIDALMEAMLTPISDRGSAAALVPLVVTVPDEAADKFSHMTFANELDDEARELRDEAIRRLALSQDAPPEVLLGTGSMNHWGAYLVQEDVVTTHLEPPLALICDAFTTQYLRPSLDAMGVANPEQYVIWYDVSHLVVRPNRTTEAVALHERGAITDKALREAAGFEDGDAPDVEEKQPEHVQIAMDMIRVAPSLASDPGLPTLVEQLRQVLSGERPDTSDQAPPPPPPSGDGGSDIPSNMPSQIGDADGPA